MDGGCVSAQYRPNELLVLIQIKGLIQELLSLANSPIS